MNLSEGQPAHIHRIKSEAEILKPTLENLIIDFVSSVKDIGKASQIFDSITQVESDQAADQNMSDLVDLNQNVCYVYIEVKDFNGLDKLEEFIHFEKIIVIESVDDSTGSHVLVMSIVAAIFLILALGNKELFLGIKFKKYEKEPNDDKSKKHTQGDDLDKIKLKIKNNIAGLGFEEGIVFGIKAIKKLILPNTIKFNEILLIESRYNNIIRENIKGIISHEQIKLEQNKITYSILLLVDFIGPENVNMDNVKKHEE